MQVTRSQYISELDDNDTQQRDDHRDLFTLDDRITVGL